MMYDNSRNFVAQVNMLVINNRQVIIAFASQGPLAFYKGFIPNFGRLGSWNVIMFLTLEQVRIDNETLSPNLVSIPFLSLNIFGIKILHSLVMGNFLIRNPV